MQTETTVAGTETNDPDIRRVVVLMEPDEVKRLDAVVDALNEAARAKRDPRRWSRSTALRQAAEEFAAKHLRGREVP